MGISASTGKILKAGNRQGRQGREEKSNAEILPFASGGAALSFFAFAVTFASLAVNRFEPVTTRWQCPKVNIQIAKKQEAALAKHFGEMPSVQ